MTRAPLAGSRHLLDLCWRNVGVLWDCLSWGIAGWAVDLAFGRGAALDWPTRSLTGFLVVVTVWQAALDNASACPRPRGDSDYRRLIWRSVLTRLGGGAIGALLISHLTGSPIMVKEAFAITATAGLLGVAGLAILPLLRIRLGKHRDHRHRQVIIYGAGRLGRECLNSIRSQPGGETARIAFVDDNPARRWREVGGCPTVGSGSDLDRLAAELGACEVVIAHASPDPGKVSNLQTQLRACDVSLSIFRAQSGSRVV